MQCPDFTPLALEAGDANPAAARVRSKCPTRACAFHKRERELMSKLCRAFIDYGAPTHHLEGVWDLSLGFKLRSWYFSETLLAVGMAVSIKVSVYQGAESVLLSFDDNLAPILVPTSYDCEQIHLANLRTTYRICDTMVSNMLGASKSIQCLEDLAGSKGPYSSRVLVLAFGVTCACIGGLVFGAQLLDLPVIFILGCFVGITRKSLRIGSKYRDVLDILTAALVSFLARFLGSLRTGKIFCFSALAQSALVLLFPAYTIGEHSPLLIMCLTPVNWYF